MIDVNKPLVTVGIPTYNRARELNRTLRLICDQTYRNLEIIVSDNASTDEEVEKVVQLAMASDNRITFHRQKENFGPHANFSFVLSNARGEFFMWAADDDRWEPFFIERCVRELVEHPRLALCQMEAQYETHSEGLFSFFPEGGAFYNFSSACSFDRVHHLIGNVYDKLVYGVFRKEFLQYRERLITEWIGPTFNEIPLLILTAFQGDVRVLPEVGMYKLAAGSVCKQAEWEQAGGRLPDWRGWSSYLRGLRPLHRYHSMVMREVSAAIHDLGFDKRTTLRLLSLERFYLLRHEFYFVIRWKPRASFSKVAQWRASGGSE